MLSDQPDPLTTTSGSLYSTVSSRRGRNGATACATVSVTAQAVCECDSVRIAGARRRSGPAVPESVSQ